MDTYQPKPRGTYTIYLLLKTIIFFFLAWNSESQRGDRSLEFFFKKKKTKETKKKERERACYNNITIQSIAIAVVYFVIYIISLYCIGLFIYLFISLPNCRCMAWHA